VFAKRAIKNSLLGRQTITRTAALSPRSLPRNATASIPPTALPPAGNSSATGGDRI
jgi:hypothetical protein